MSSRFLKIALVYALLGIGFGIFMAASGNHGDMPVHAHINLVGWVSMALTALCYRAMPELSASRLAPAHFWLTNLSLPVMLAGVFAIHRGNPGLGEPLAGIGSIGVALGFVCFALNVWVNLREPQTASGNLAFHRA